MIKTIFVILIVIVVITILMVFYLQNLKKEINEARYLPNYNYNDIFYDRETGKTYNCPRSCPVFSFKKQKCVRGNLQAYNVCPSNKFGNIRHKYRCDVFIFCAQNLSNVVYLCTETTCFDNEQGMCVPCPSKNCSSNDSIECTDCCEIKDEN
uniref:Uncharacterized protein n=1 Tax=Spodoptera frugiperda nuclear polyhedrosis virus TaxID=10455 RepID=B2KX01_NPVSF|nr:unknown [Spodoptera frugiperda multiple nucleopolyhedrovirus]QWS70887.1 hypothetical protein [Spodoptera frugiperda multiple nucleopolyhedrovirus]